MIHGEKAPRTDNEVINWIAERRLRGSGSGSGSGNGGSGSGGSGGGGLGGGSLEGIGGSDGPVAFGGEMFSSGDEQFAYIGDDTSTSQSAMVRLAGNMASLDNIDAMVAPDSRARGGGPGSSSSGGGNTNGGKAQSAKGKALDDAFASYQAARDRDMPGGQRRI